MLSCGRRNLGGPMRVYAPWKRMEMTMRMTRIAIVGAIVLVAALFAGKIIGNGLQASRAGGIPAVAEASPPNPQQGY